MLKQTKKSELYKYIAVDAYYSFPTNKLNYIIKKINKKTGEMTKIDGFIEDPKMDVKLAPFERKINYFLPSKDLEDFTLPYKDYFFIRKSIKAKYNGENVTSKNKKYKELVSLEKEIYDDYKIETQFLHNEQFEYDEKYSDFINFAFWDIEVYHDDSGFPEAYEAKFPINAITNFERNGNVPIFVLLDEHHKKEPEEYEKEILDKLKEEFKDYNFTFDLHLFDRERELIKEYLNYIKKYDALVGWHSIDFDTQYMFTRCKLLGLEEEFLDSFGEMFEILNLVDRKAGMETMTFYTTKILTIDYIHLIKFFDPTNYPSYSINNIAARVLKGQDVSAKVQIDNLNVEYIKNLPNFVYYNVTDVILNKDIDEKMMFVVLLFKFKGLTHGFTTSSLSINNILDSYISLMCKEMGISCISAMKSSTYFANKIWNIYRRLNVLSDKKLEFIKKLREDDKSYNIFLNDDEVEKYTGELNEDHLDDSKGIELNKKDIPFIYDVFKYPGAYVKKPKKGVYTNIVDLDASLPPWEKIYIKRDGNISLIKIGEYEFKDGDETLSWNDNNDILWSKVYGKTEHDWNNDIVTIITETGKELTVTTNHSIFGIKKGDTSHSKYDLIDAGKLEKGDYVVAIKKFESCGLLKSICPELIGFWSSDGWRHGKECSSRLNYYKIKKELPHANDSFSDFVGLEKIKELKYTKYNGKVYDISVENTERFFSGSGIGAHNTSMYPSTIYATNCSCDTWIYQVPENIALKYIYEKERFPEFLEKHKFEFEIYDVLNDKFQRINSDNLMKVFDNIVKKEFVITETGAIFLPAHEKEGFFRKLIKKPISERQSTKKIMKSLIKEMGLLSDSSEIINLGSHEKSLKILANSVYGFLGFRLSRLANVILATSITITSQLMIRHVAIHCQDILDDLSGKYKK